MQKHLTLEIREISSPSRITIVELGGILDSLELEKAEKPIKELLHDERQQNIVFDLLKLEYFNSTGLGLLVHTAIKAVETGKHIVFVIDPNEYVYDLFEVTGGVKVMKIYNQLGEAVNSYQRTGR